MAARNREAYLERHPIHQMTDSARRFALISTSRIDIHAERLKMPRSGLGRHTNLVG